MKVLVAGLGSVGQRHARNLRTLFGASCELLAYRVRRRSGVITEQLELDRQADVETALGIQTFADLDEALAQRPDVAVICNPTSAHVPTALSAARAGCHLFIEKPLSDGVDGVGELLEAVEQRGLVAAVGYQLRFHPVLRRARALLCQGAIGRPLTAEAEFGEYLPVAHPYEDYRESYAARASLGGGVILCYIHEVDYLCWLLGTPRRVFTTGGRLGSLEIDVEDTALSTFEFERDGGLLPVHLRQSFLQRPTSRRCTIIGESGTLQFDLANPSLTLATSTSSHTETFASFCRNSLFIDEIEDFFRAISEGGSPAVPLRAGIQSLRVALAMRESLQSGLPVEIAA